MVDTSIIATAADYADAMLTARRAKNWLFLILFVLLLAQLAVFFLYRTDVIKLGPPSTGAARAIATAPTTIPASQNTIELLLIYLIGLSDFLGVILVIVLALVLLLVTNIMLVGRLIGVSRITSAYIWTLLLIVLLFPWQAFLRPLDFKIPGVLYTWDELITTGHWTATRWTEDMVKWTRFVAFPVVAIILLCIIQIKSSRGIRQALGEADTTV